MYSETRDGRGKVTGPGPHVIASEILEKLPWRKSKFKATYDQQYILVPEISGLAHGVLTTFMERESTSKEPIRELWQLESGGIA